MSDLSFRRVNPGETAVERVVRILKHLADLYDPQHTADAYASRALLEPGARDAAWTCMVTLRAAIYHACLLPEDGWPVIDISGQKFGKYTPGMGLIDGALRAWGNGSTYFGLMGQPIPEDGLPLAPGASFCTGNGSHVGAICHVFPRGNGLVDIFTVEGGQAAIAEAGTRTWMDDDTSPTGVREVRLTKHAPDDHAQRFVRTLRMSGSRWENLGPDGAPKPTPSRWDGVALLNVREILTAPAMSEEECARVAELAAEQARDNALTAMRPPNPLEDRPVLTMDE